MRTFTFFFVFFIVFSNFTNSSLINTDYGENSTKKDDFFVLNTRDIKIKDTFKQLEVPPLNKSHFKIISSGSYYDGLNLFVLTRKNLSNNLVDCFVTIIDMKGNIIKEKYIGTKKDYAYLPAKFINSTSILYGGLKGCYVWNIYNDKTYYFNIIGHHEYEYNPNSNTIFTINSYVKTYNGVKYQFERIVEKDLDGTEVWRFEPHTFLNEDIWCPYGDMIGDAKDVTHGNTVFYDATEDIIYFNCRNLNTFYKISHSTSKVIWGLGEYGNFSLYNEKGIESKNLFYHAHSVERIDTNKFILFDNDKHNQTKNSNQHSRIVEIKINEDTMTANISWVWEGSTEYYSDVWGDADRLPNGNRLGIFGTYNHPSSSCSAILTEVNRTGNIVWELRFPKEYGYAYGIYRAERFNLAPTILNHSLDINTNFLSFNVVYNFRTKIEVRGTYELYIDYDLVDYGELIYDRFWRVTSKKVNFISPNISDFNITFIISDERGHNAEYVIVCENIEISNDKVSENINFYTIAGIGILVFIFKRRRK